MTRQPVALFGSLFILFFLVVASGCGVNAPTRFDEFGSFCDAPNEEMKDARFATAASAAVDRLVRENAPLYRQALATAQELSKAPLIDPIERPIIGFGKGERFPTIFLSRKRADRADVRLDPIMREHSLSALSRVAIDDDSARVAIIGTHAQSSSEILVMIDSISGRSEVIARDAHDAVWSKEHLLYSVTREGQPRQVFARTPNSLPALVRATSDPTTALLLSKNRTGSLLLIEESSPTESSLAIYDAHTPHHPIARLSNEPRGVACAGDVTNVACLSFHRNPYGDLIRYPRSLSASPRLLLAGNAAAPIVAIDAVGDTIAAFTSRGSSTELLILNSEGTQLRSITPRHPVTTWSPIKDDRDPLTLRVRERSFLRPTTIKTLAELARDSEQAPEPSSECDTCREEALIAQSPDGTGVPISLALPPEPVALLVFAYGAYGIATPAEHSPYIASLLRHGVAVAIAHVRGGGERGPMWHRGALGETKLNATMDLSAAIDAIQKHTGITPSRTFVSGRSAGGWLVSRTQRERPDLARGLILEAPLVSFGRGSFEALDSRDRVEWGHDARALRRFQPTLETGKLPLSLLLMVPLDDSRISPTEVIRWGREAACANPSSRHVLLAALADTGHDGPTDRASLDRWMAMRETFILATIAGDTP